MFGISGGSGWGYSLTPGIMLRLARSLDPSIPPPITIGFKIDELVNYQKWGTDTVEQVPARAILGLAWAQLPRIGGRGAIDISQTVKSGYCPEVATGYEWSERGLSFRVGYNTSGLTAGVGFAIGHAIVDYGFVSQRELSKNNVHRISLSGKW
ncbi:MAG: hypothetical protein KKC80_07030 [Candidatus Margulisbacteria bacterium]|nr:hypothetical protein [Candidatus Margulisiibacteriota bacterium]MBU1617558.1 hypothetical protein [Candidatus Margulisiibacteriota bacterium]